ncbi:MAG: hypothetical protein WCN86_00720 [bacterium]
MKSKNLQDLIKNLQVFYKCPSCGSSYIHDDIAFLGSVEEHCFMQLTCHDCSLPVLATVFMQSELDKAGKQNGSKLGRKADLGYRERAKFIDRGPISSQEIAAFHLYLTQTKAPRKSKKSK